MSPLSGDYSPALAIDRYPLGAVLALRPASIGCQAMETHRRRVVATHYLNTQPKCYVQRWQTSNRCPPAQNAMTTARSPATSVSGAVRLKRHVVSATQMVLRHVLQALTAAKTRHVGPVVATVQFRSSVVAVLGADSHSVLPVGKYSAYRSASLSRALFTVVQRDHHRHTMWVAVP